MPKPGIPNELVLSTSCYGPRLRSIEDQAFSAVAMGFRRLELGLSATPPELRGWEDAERLSVLNLLYDVTPAECVKNIVCESGLVAPADVPSFLR